MGVATPVAIGAGLLVGAAAGLVNGLLITRTGINGFVITLATASAFTGITIGLNNAEPFYNLPPAFVAFGQARLGPVPGIGVITILVTLGLSFLFRRTVLGRQILAVGGNPRSAALSGIRVDPIIVVTHTLSGLLSAIAAILLMARLGSAQPVDRVRLAAAVVRDSHCRRRGAQRRRGADRVDGAGRLFDRLDREWSGPRQSRSVLDPVSPRRHHSGCGGTQPSAPRVDRWLGGHRDTRRVTATAPRLSEDQAISPVALELRGIDKTFPGVRALSDVDLILRYGEIHALVGENGAGKSTLLKIMTGVYQPDAGTIQVDGAERRFASPRDAIQAGIGTVHQERNLIPRFSVAENITLERPPPLPPA